MLAGFLLTAALVVVVTFGAAVLLALPPEGPPTAVYLVLNLMGSAAAGVAGGYLCARIAPRAPAQHVLALAVLVLVLSLPAVFSQPVPGRPEWYPAVLAVLGPASIVLGGWLFLRRSHAWRGASSPVSSATTPG